MPALRQIIAQGVAGTPEAPRHPERKPHVLRYHPVSARVQLDGDVYDVTFSPDGSSIATASGDSTAKIWNPETGDLLIDLTDRVGLRQPGGSVTWPIPPRELTRVGCERLRPFTEEYEEAAHICDPLLDE